MDSALPLTKATDNPKKHTEDSSTDTDEGNKEKIIDAKPPTDDTITMVLLPTNHHRNPPNIDIANTEKGGVYTPAIDSTTPPHPWHQSVHRR
jgi:hypothetical protein